MPRVILVLLFVALAAPAAAQTRLTASFGATSSHLVPSSALVGDYLGRNWTTSRDLGLGLERPLGRRLAVAARFEWDRLPYRGAAAGPGPVAFPEWIPAGREELDASTWRWSLALRWFGETDGPLRPFVATGPVYVVEVPGSLEFVSIATNGPVLTQLAQYPGRYYWAHEAEVGLRAHAGGPVAAEFVGGFITNYGDRVQARWRGGVVVDLPR